MYPGVHGWGVLREGTTSCVLLHGPQRLVHCRCLVGLLAEGMKEEGPSLNPEQRRSQPGRGVCVCGGWVAQ